MPFYEYECSNCKFYSEVLQKVSDPPLKKCPSCKKSTMKKLISAPVFRLKGGGWYETDFKSDKEGRRNLAMDKEPAANDSSMDSKPDKAGEAKSGDPKSGDGKAADSKPGEGGATRAGSAASGGSKAAGGSTPRSRSRAASAAKRPAVGRAKSKSKAASRSKRR